MNRDVVRTWIATAAVAALVAVVAITEPTAPVRHRAELIPGFAPATVTRVELRRGDRAVAVVVAAGATRVEAPTPGTADVAVVTDLISTLAAARVDRWSAARRTAPRAVVTVTADRTLELRIGDEIAATGQTWIDVGDRAALVPAWVARALARDPDDLRQRRLFAPGLVPTGVELHAGPVDVVLAGAALVRRDPDGRSLRINADLRAALIERVTALAIAQFEAVADAGPPLGELRVFGGPAPIEVAWWGPCHDAATVRAVTSVGAGCLERQALDAVVAAARAVAGPDAASAAPWSAAAPLIQLAVEGGLTLDRDGGGWRLTSGGARWDADAATVEAVVAALSRAAVVRPRTAAAGATWTLRAADGDQQRWQVRAGSGSVVIARGDEPSELVISGDDAAALAAVGPGLRARQPWRIDPAQVSSLDATGLAPGAVRRGAVIGEWQAVGASASPAAAALPAIVAGLTVDAWGPRSRLGAVRRTVRVTLDGEPPVTIAVGAATRGGCWVAFDDAMAAQVAATTCAALLAPLTTR